VLGREHWNADAYGQLFATAHNLRLVIRQFDDCARYLIIRSITQGSACGEIMLASGTEPSVHAAMAAAERTAKRIEPTFAEHLNVADQPGPLNRGVRRGSEEGEPMGSRFHVLVVEDEPLVLDIIETTLEEEYRVSSARTVGEAHAILQTSHIDVALIDNVLPDGRGDEVAAFAEEVGAIVIKMTGYSPESVDQDTSGRPHLFKPFALNTLLSTVGNALHDHQWSDIRSQRGGGRECSRRISKPSRGTCSSAGAAEP
jgi:CheY-like chemotaxis protein